MQREKLPQTQNAEEDMKQGLIVVPLNAVVRGCVLALLRRVYTGQIEGCLSREWDSLALG